MSEITSGVGPLINERPHLCMDKRQLTLLAAVENVSQLFVLASARQPANLQQQPCLTSVSHPQLRKFMPRDGVTSNPRAARFGCANAVSAGAQSWGVNRPLIRLSNIHRKRLA
jgi:hypothetical protein